MKVKELIEELELMDPDAIIVYGQQDPDYGTYHDIRIVGQKRLINDGFGAYSSFKREIDFVGTIIPAVYIK